MSRPFPLQNQFSRMERDLPRNRLSDSAAWNLVDIIPDYGASARERGGWAHVNSASAISAITGTASYIRGGIYAVFSPTGGADAANMCIDEDGVLYRLSTVPTLVGATRTLAQNPIFHGGAAASAATATYTGLLIIPDATMAAVPKKYNGTTISDLGGTPPKAKFGSVYRDYTILAHGYVGSTYYPNREWFSPPGDPDCAVSGSVTAWDTTDAWIDYSQTITGVANTKNAHLVFHKGQITRVRGAVPPPDGDLVVDDPWVKIGLLDPFSITEHEERVYWCAPEGVFVTDGVMTDNLAVKGEMLKYWLDLVPDDATGYSFSTGVLRGKLFVVVMNGTTFVDAFMIDLSSYAWTRLSNIDAVSVWSGLYNSADDLFFARRNSTHVGRLDTIFQVGDSTYKNDAGTAATANPATAKAVASVIETPFYELGRPGLKNVKSLFAGFFLQDFASDNPTVAVSYVNTPEETSYTSIGTLSENTEYNRKRLGIGGRHWGVAFKFARSAAGDFQLHDLSAEVNYQQESKRK